MIVVVAIAALLLSMGLPAFRTMIANRAAAAHVQAFGDSVRFARSEALKRGMPVSMCMSANPLLDKPACAVAAQGWGTGWVVFLDRDGDRSFDDGSDTVLRREQPAASTGGATSTKNGITFQANGLAVGASELDIQLLDKTGANSKKVCVSKVGRINVVEAGASCS
jgi:type IV fimbrial biogenesis protein FimT